MNTSDIPGAKWWRFDFHTHTPMSHDYGRGDGSQKLISPEEWLLAHMKAEIDCVAITDHNSGQWIDVLKSKLSMIRDTGHPEFRPLILFPGVEISVNGGIHILALLDPSKTSADVAALLGAVDYTGEHGQTDACTSKSVVDVLKVIENFNGVAIPAHVDGPAGLFQVIGSGTTLRQISEETPPLAFEVLDHNFSLPAAYLSLQMSPTFVQGSDSHLLSEIGRKSSWIKMQSPNIDSLKLALHDGTDGVKTIAGACPNQHSGLRLQSLTVKNGRVAGRGNPLEVQFSPWMTTLIGGRGSGKSAIVQYMRIVLDQSKGMPTSVQEEFDSFFRIPANRKASGMLTADTQIDLEFSQGSRRFVLTWHQGNRQLVEFSNTTNSWQNVPLGDLRSRFPIRIFNQKELFELTRQPDYLIGLIDNAINGRLLEETKARMQSAHSAFLTSRRKEREHRRVATGLSLAQARLSDINAKLKEFESVENAALFRSIDQVNSLDAHLSAGKLWLSQLSEVLDSVFSGQTVPSISQEFLDSLDSLELEGFQDGLNILSEISSDVQSLRDKVKEAAEKWDSVIAATNWHHERTSKLAQLQEVNQRFARLGIGEGISYEALLQDRNLYQKVANDAIIANDLANSESQNADRHAQDFLDARNQLTVLRTQIAQAWSQSSGGHLRIQVNLLSNLEQAEASLREIIRRPDTSFAKDLYLPGTNGDEATGLISKLLNGDPNWQSRGEIISDLFNGAFGSNPAKLDARLCDHLRKLNDSTPEDIDRLLLWVPDDTISLFLVHEGREKAIESGSGGQRTASILAVLLKTAEGPLVIDQPEDDLDARYIMELIVKGLRDLKQEQQVIVVTHNPNIPVNGGAEQIIEMSFVNGQIIVEESGALQNREVRQAVCDVMEGGKEALLKRYVRVAKAL